MFGTKQHDDNKDDKKWFVSCNDATNWPFRNNNSIIYCILCCRDDWSSCHRFWQCFFFKNSLLAALVARKYATLSSQEITLYCYWCIKNGLIIILNNNNGWNYNKSNWEYNTVKRLRRLCWFDAKIESIGLNSNIVLLLLFVKGFHFLSEVYHTRSESFICCS